MNKLTTQYLNKETIINFIKREFSINEDTMELLPIVKYVTITTLLFTLICVGYYYVNDYLTLLAMYR